MHTAEIKWGRKASSVLEQTHGLCLFRQHPLHSDLCQRLEENVLAITPLEGYSLSHSATSRQVYLLSEHPLQKLCLVCPLPSTRLETSNNCNTETNEGEKLVHLSNMCYILKQ